jgi:hypothetical protein
MIESLIYWSYTVCIVFSIICLICAVVFYKNPLRFGFIWGTVTWAILGYGFKQLLIYIQ